MENSSKYEFNVDAKTSKKWYASILDSLTSFIFTVLFFFLVALIFDSTKLIKDKKEILSSSQYELNKIVMKVKLDEFTSESSFTLKGTDTITSDYIKQLSYSSLVEGKASEDEISKEFYKDTKKLTKDDDRLYYYNLIFKTEYKSDYSSSTKFIDFNIYLNDFKEKTAFIMDENSEDKSYLDLNVIDDYILLSLNDSKDLDTYIRTGKTTRGRKIYEAIYSFYYSSIKESIEDVKNNYLPYVNEYKIYEQNESSMFIYRHVELLIAYILAIFTTYFLIPLIFKDGITLSMKVFKLAIVKKSKKKYSLLISLYRVIYNLFKNVLYLPIVFLVLYSISARVLLVSSLIFNLPLIYYPIFSLVIILVSLILSCIKSTNNEMLDEILFRYNIVDTTEFISNDKKEIDIYSGENNEERI